mgnify:CR=1 FL=1
MKNDKSISKLFLERGQFVLIGLTGRTGSGCTTAANILESKDPKFPTHHDATYKGIDFYEGLSKKRYNLVKKYAEKNWDQFYSIKVSDLISAYLLSMNVKYLKNFIFKTYKGKGLTKKQVKTLLKKGVFKNNFIIHKFKDFQEYVLNHDSKERLPDERLEHFIRYLKLVRKFTNDFKKELNNLKNDLYISTYQAAGISIRKLGRVDSRFDVLDFSPDSVFHLPETINRTIKIIRAIKDRAFIVIDAIRNPYEARFFKDRYAAFYLVSINAPPKDRSEYLKNTHKFTVDQLKEIDNIESGKKNIPHKEFIGQNVKKCIEISDVHIFNPRKEVDNNNVLRSQLAWYFSLMLHPGLISPTAMERVMQLAYTAKTNSGCISRQVGAAITDSSYSVKAIGWNDVPQGQFPCSLRSADGLLNEFDAKIYSEYERNDSDFREVVQKKFGQTIALNENLNGRNLSYCFKDMRNTVVPERNQVHTRSLHAEENAFLQIVKYGGQGIEGGKLFTTASPCELCAKKAYQLGIKEIIYIDPYPGIARDHIISIGSKPPNLTQFRGAVGKGYHQLYEPTLPYKDELEYFL